MTDLIGLTAHILSAPHVSIHHIQIGWQMGHSLPTPQRSKFCFFSRCGTLLCADQLKTCWPDAFLLQDDEEIDKSACQHWAANGFAHHSMAGDWHHHFHSPDIFRDAQIFQAIASKATVRTLGMTCCPWSNSAFRQPNQASGVKALHPSWPSSASQQQACRFWPVQTPERAMVSEACCFDMWSLFRTMRSTRSCRSL